MHEYSIVQALMAQVEKQAAAHGAVAVHRVAVRIGELSGVEPDLLSSAFEMVRDRTVCSTATLDIRRVAAKWVCRQCGSGIAGGGVLACPACGGTARLAEGDEIVLDQLELEVGDV
jgi:hydrogenase nickel incorporation protein HypA/HybF